MVHVRRSGLEVLAGGVDRIGRFGRRRQGVGERLAVGFGMRRVARDGRLGRDGGRSMGLVVIAFMVVFVVAFMAVIVMRDVLVAVLRMVVMMRMVIMAMIVLAMIVLAMIMMTVIIMTVIVVMSGLFVQVLAVVPVVAVLRRMLAVDGERSQLGAGLMTRDDIAANTLAMTAPAGIAVARAAAAVGAVFAFLLGFAMGLFFGLDQRLPVGDRDLVVIRMDFAEGEEAVAVAAILDEGRLQRGFDPGDLGEVDVPAQLLALRGLEIKLFDAVAANHDDPGLLRVGGVDQHLVGHVLTLGGDGRMSPRARAALPGDATVHLIRG